MKRSIRAMLAVAILALAVPAAALATHNHDAGRHHDRHGAPTTGATGDTGTTGDRGSHGGNGRDAARCGASMLKAGVVVLVANVQLTPNGILFGGVVLLPAVQ